MAGHGRILLNMTSQNGRNGPKCFHWLDAKYSRSDTNAAVQKLRNIVDLAPFPADDVDASIDQLLTANAANEGLVLPDQFMSAIIVLKLPSACDVISKVQLAKHCLAQSACPIPASIPAPVRAKLLARRKAFLAKKEVGAVAVELPSLADEADLMEWLADHDSGSDCHDCED
jgi:hypothetical protein